MAPPEKGRESIVRTKFMSNNIQIINGFSLVSISILVIIRIIIVIGIIIFNVFNVASLFFV